jgi:hypothetical protein
MVYILLGIPRSIATARLIAGAAPLVLTTGDVIFSPRHNYKSSKSFSGYTGVSLLNIKVPRQRGPGASLPFFPCLAPQFKKKDELHMSAYSFWRPVSLLALVPLALAAAVPSKTDAVPLKHWAAPLYYQSVHTDAASVTSTTPLTFVAIPPCRLADTRVQSGYPALGSSPLAAQTPATLPIAGSCGTPSSPVPLAYSLNVTVIPVNVTDAGYLTLYPNPTSPVPLAASLTWNVGETYDTNAVVVESSSDGSVNFYARFPTDVVVDINGYYIAQPSRNASLVFNAESMTVFPSSGAETTLQTTLTASAGTLVLPAMAWAVGASTSANLMLTFNVPANYSAVSSPVVYVHYLTGPNSTPPAGTVDLDVFFCSAPAVTNFTGSCFVQYSQTIATSDATLSTVYTYNHYDVAYTLSGYSVSSHTITAGDFAALTIQRPTDTFGDLIYITSVEFYYPTN